MDKYYLVRKSEYTGRVEYKMHKTLDDWCSESLKEKCWQFSKQGALKYIERKKERSGLAFHLLDRNSKGWSLMLQQNFLKCSLTSIVL